MRLGQLARKYDVSLQEIISYLNEIDPKNESLHHNSKLDEQIELMVIEHFDVRLDSPEDYQEVIAVDAPEESEQIPEEPAIAINEETEADLQMELDPSLPPIKVQESHNETEKKPKKERQVIETDRLIELMESEDTEVDLSNITLIKAPKKELDGLKILGKIDLPEPKSKTDVKSEQAEEEPKPDRDVRHDRRRLSDEELEKRRLNAKKKKEEYEGRQEERRKNEKKKRIKANKKERYEQKMQQGKVSQPKHKLQVQDEPPEVNVIPTKPTTILGKFWNWLKA
jgi:hypothetical protein